MKAAAQKKTDTLPEILPIIPTIDVVVFPRMIVPLLVLDERIIRGIEQALESESKLVLLLASQKQSSNHQGAIGTKDLFEVGTVASIMRLIKMPEGGIKILVQGHYKARVQSITTENEILCAQVNYLNFNTTENQTEITEQVKNIKGTLEKLTNAGQGLSPDFHIILSKINDPEKIADFIISHLSLPVAEAQPLLEIESYSEFLSKLHEHLAKEIEVAEVQERIKNHARDSMNRSQKEFYLREQLKAIKKELGDEDSDEIEKFRTKLTELKLNEEATQEIERQINRLEKTTPDSMEAAVLRSYLELALSLPWNHETTDNLDLNQVRAVLDHDHYGMKDVKERILDFISIKALKKDGATPILCLFGPPGTGKTSLGASIAKSLGREYLRISLGGVKDEAEIRGHRRTYVGAMPGRFIQGLRKAKSKNPVIIIDELDKLGADFRGDPASAMLEVLDPNQNKTFYDNYLGIPFDLSHVFFIATANSLDTIPGPLRDRMEIIQLTGYSPEEKIRIASEHLVQQALESTGLEGKGIEIPKPVIESIILDYTRESGVRELGRMLKKLCSKAARILVEKGEAPIFTPENIETYLGPKRFIDEESNKENKVGICNGLAWTAYGGEMIKIEVVMMPGKGLLLLTGQLGDVMKESAQAALSYARAHAAEFGIDQTAFTAYDLHIHVPAGAVPKDGPSAGITMLTAVLSALTGRKIDADYAMTGEINLQGNIMPIGGVKEKILAAKRNGIHHVILPNKNKQDIQGIEELVKGVQLIWAGHANDILDQVLLKKAQ